MCNSGNKKGKIEYLDGIEYQQNENTEMEESCTYLGVLIIVYLSEKENQP